LQFSTETDTFISTATTGGIPMARNISTQTSVHIPDFSEFSFRVRPYEGFTVFEVSPSIHSTTSFYFNGVTALSIVNILQAHMAKIEQKFTDESKTQMVTLPYDIVKECYELLTATGHYAMHHEYNHQERELAQSLTTYIDECDLYEVHSETNEDCEAL
jgi:hypothetical protein